MDSERRNRVAALLATTEHLPVPVMREVLGAHDALEKENLRLRAQLLDAQLSISMADARASVHKEDADRLADWIIRHPSPGLEMSALLDMHDRLA